MVGQNGRHRNGTFAIGNRGGPGRPRGVGRELAALRAELHRVLSPEVFAQVVERLVHLALHATDERVSLDAADSLLDRALGKPRQQIEVDDASGPTIPLEALAEVFSNPALREAVKQDALAFLRSGATEPGPFNHMTD